jgi:hypothetical protein
MSKEWKANESAEKRDEDGFQDSWRITVAVPLTLDALTMEMANQEIGHKLGGTIAGVEQEDYASQTYVAPKGSPPRMGSPTGVPSIFGGSTVPGDQPSNIANPRGAQRTDMVDNATLQLAEKFAQEHNQDLDAVLEDIIKLGLNYNTYGN